MNPVMLGILEQARTLTQFSPEDEEVLREASEALLPLGDEVKKVFYDVLFGYEPTVEVFRNLSQSRFEREATLKKWFELTFSGHYDDKFWEWQWFVGLVHIQHHVSHAFMLSMMTRVQALLLRKCMELFEEASAERVFSAILRLTSCIAIFMVEGYHQQFLDAIDRAGLRKSLVDRLVTNEVRDMVKDFRKST